MDHKYDIELYLKKIDELYATANRAKEKLDTGHKASAVIMRSNLSEMEKTIKLLKKSVLLHVRSLPKKTMNRVGVDADPENLAKQQESSDIVSRKALLKYF